MDSLVSVIVPVYNTAPYLERCIRSVLDQSYSNIELILIDDGSTDNSGEICDNFRKEDNRIRVFHKSNGGVSSARNIGLLNMRGEYFMFLDSDDSLEFDAIRTCVDVAQKSQADVVIFGWKELYGGETRKIGRYAEGIQFNTPQMVQQVLEDRHIYGGGYPNKMWRTRAFMEGTMPLFSEKLFYVEDMEWVVRMLLKAKRAAIIQDVFYVYHLRDDSASRSTEGNIKRLIGYHDTLAQIESDLIEYPEMQCWFSSIRHTELINSIIDAKLKKQQIVYRTLYTKLQHEIKELLVGSLLPVRIKVRLLGVWILHKGRAI